jgi:hypothetical protein
MSDSRQSIDSTDRVACPVCGAARNRESARFCAACGQDLSADYAPAGLLKASYHRRRQSSPAPVGQLELPARWLSREDGLTALAFAFVTFSVVPFLGILFCPVALLLGICCFARRKTHARIGLGRPTVAIALTVVVSTVQVGLWWMLTHVPGAERL